MKIEILMAVYEPNPAWLREQLLSLNAQTHRPLSLRVRDDASARFPFATLEAMLRECITAFPFVCLRNAENIGSNQTFARLTEEAEADALAYCDQDDAWEPDKLQRLAQAMESTDARLVCSDLRVMDEEGRPMAESIRDIKPHIVYRSGIGLAPLFLTANFVTGCACLVRADTAKAALPFPRWTVHDQWLGLMAANEGRVVSLPEKLVRYRIHRGNQTATFGNIRTRADYIEAHVLRDSRRVAEFHDRVNLGQPQRRLEAWMDARVALARGVRGAWLRLLGCCGVNWKISAFELLLPLLPDAVFRLLADRIRRGKL